MATEKFTVSDFEAAMDVWKTYRVEYEWEHGQYVARVYDGNFYLVKIYSSISQDGVARDTGNDSIRLVLLKKTEYGDEKPVISTKLIKEIFGSHYVTRASGWQGRMHKKIGDLIELSYSAGECSICGGKSIFKTKKPGANQGRLFSNCHNRSHKTFKWIDTQPQQKEPQEQTSLMNALDNAEGKVEKAKVMINWSSYQRAAFDFVRDSDGNMVIDAVAGSGKTTTLEQIMEICLERYGARITIMFCAFNKHIVDALRAKVDHMGFRITTLHSKGLQDIKRTLGRGIRVNEYKVFNIFDKLVGHERYQRHDPGDTIMNHKPGVAQIVGLLKMLMIRPTQDNVDMLVNVYGIDIGDDKYPYEYIVDIAIEAYEISIANKHEIDFNDMIFYPAMGLFGVVPEQFDIVLIDELQDLNKCQRILVLKSYKMRILGVGDPCQSIYGWSGADKSAFQAFINETESTVLPLSITYRCSISVTEVAQGYVPHIRAKENAPIGEVSRIYHDQLVRIAEEGDIIECRVNAPLIPLAYQFIRNGKKAIVLGRDIGKGLTSHIDRMIRSYQADNIDELSMALRGYAITRGDKLLKQNKKGQAEALFDKTECIQAMIASCGAENIFQLKDEINNLFHAERAGITLTSIHKIKGQEPEGNGTVFLLHPERLFPDWGDPQEEIHVAYVAVTRAKENLTYVLKDRR